MFTQHMMKEKLFSAGGLQFRVRHNAQRVEVRQENDWVASAWYSPEQMLRRFRGPGCVKMRSLYKTALVRAIRAKNGYGIFHSTVR